MQDLWVLPTDLALSGHILHFLREDVPMSHFTYLPSRENHNDCLSLSIVIKPHACTIPFSQTSESTVMSLLYFSLNGSKWLHCRRGFCLLIVIEQNQIKYRNTTAAQDTPQLSQPFQACRIWISLYSTTPLFRNLAQGLPDLGSITPAPE